MSKNKHLKFDYYKVLTVPQSRIKYLDDEYIGNHVYNICIRMF